MLSSRRTFLGYAATVSVVASADPNPEIKFPTIGRDRLSVTSYPFRALIESPTNSERQSLQPGIDLTRFPSLIAEKFGVYNINPLVDHFSSTDTPYLDRFRKAVADARSHIVDLGLPGRRFFASESSTRRQAVESGRKWIDIAAVVGSPSVRQHVSGSSDENNRVEMACDSLGQLAIYAKQRGIVINLENDNAIAEDPFFLVNVIEKVNSPFLRALPDFGNSLIGHDARYSEKGVAGMLKHAYNMCHVKDVVTSETGQRYEVDLKKMFALAKAASYRGYFSMEFDTQDHDPFAGTKRLIEETLQYLT